MEKRHLKSLSLLSAGVFVLAGCGGIGKMNKFAGGLDKQKIAGMFNYSEYEDNPIDILLTFKNTPVDFEQTLATEKDSLMLLQKRQELQIELTRLKLMAKDDEEKKFLIDKFGKDLNMNLDILELPDKKKDSKLIKDLEKGKEENKKEDGKEDKKKEKDSTFKLNDAIRRFNSEVVKNLFDISNNYLKEDWEEWLTKTSIELLLNSPSKVLYCCRTFANVNPSIEVHRFTGRRVITLQKISRSRSQSKANALRWDG